MSSPFGSGPYGLGTPATVSPVAGFALEDANGVRQNSRKIDPYTLDIAMNLTTGRAVGMNDKQANVQQCISTDHGSSAMLTLGNKLRQQTVVSDNFRKEADNVIRSCLKLLTDSEAIAINAILPERIQGKGSGVFVRVQWTDPETGKQYENIVK